jgi:hypothetical protein
MNKYLWIVAILLVGCGQRAAVPSVQKQVDDYCSQYNRDRSAILKLPQYQEKSSIQDAFWALSDCVDQESKALSVGTDDAGTIAKAVRSICDPKLLEYEYEKKRQFNLNDANVQQQFLRDSEDDEDNSRKVIVQTRAAHCPVQQTLR